MTSSAYGRNVSAVRPYGRITAPISITVRRNFGRKKPFRPKLSSFGRNITAEIGFFAFCRITVTDETRKISFGRSLSRAIIFDSHFRQIRCSDQSGTFLDKGHQIFGRDYRNCRTDRLCWSATSRWCI